MKDHHEPPRVLPESIGVIEVSQNAELYAIIDASTVAAKMAKSANVAHYSTWMMRLRQAGQTALFWRAQPGGEAILLNMIHEVHNVRMLCCDLVAVQAFASNAVRGFAVEDTVAVCLKFINVVLGAFML